MKILLASLTSLLTVSAFAGSAGCAVVDAKSILRLEQEVTIQGMIIENPMVTAISNSDPLKASIMDYRYIMIPGSDILLEQWSSDQANYACKIGVITLELNKKQREVIEKSIAKGFNAVMATGKITEQKTT